MNVPSLLWIVSGVSNMNFSQADHHNDSVDRSPSYMLITVGRHTGYSDPTTLIVFVIRSGIDASRLLPNSGSYQRKIDDGELVSTNGIHKLKSGPVAYISLTFKKS